MNIYQIQSHLLELFDELEANGGELTPEIEEELGVTQDDFLHKVEDYVNVIKSLNTDIDAIKAEKKRLSDLQDRKSKVVERLSRTIINAIKDFGDMSKSGSMFIDYGIGKVSIRKSQAVEVDEDAINKICSSVNEAIEYAREFNQLDVDENIDQSALIEAIAAPRQHEDTIIHGIDVSEDDLKHTDLTLSITVPVSSFTDGSNYYLLKAIAKKGNVYSLKPSINKTNLKKELKVNGACAPRVARLVENENLTIK